MMNKDNFLLKTSLLSVVETLSDEDAGRLFKGILRYVNDEDSQLTGLLNTVFIPIKESIDKNEENYQKVCERNKSNGSKGGAPIGNKNAQKNKTTENNRLVEKTTENNPKQHDARHNHNSYIINHNLRKDNKGVIGGKEEKIDTEFDILWSIYPKKRGKEQARQKYSLARKQGATYEEVRQGLEHYIKFCETLDEKFIKHGSTWFNQKCWEDDYSTKSPTWFNKNVEKDIATTEEIDAMNELLGDFK